MDFGTALQMLLPRFDNICDSGWESCLRLHLLRSRHLVKTGLLKLEAEVEGLTSHNAFPMLCYFFSFSASSCDSDNSVFTRS